ncbi:protein of unknown function [Agrobacterium pusense]|uniref:Uncharacterized protein n=1 Tax=Agrobacterium pusense TaxID=648995 RepID=U4Q1N3_9HYPH|nr:protein of unknown function [Agrobacterium pusense]
MAAPLDLVIQIVQKADNIYYVPYATIMKDEFDADRRNKAGREPGICKNAGYRRSPPAFPRQRHVPFR